MKVLSISVSLCLALAGCNMMAGLGDDMQQAGVNLRQRATEAQPNGTPDYGSEGIYNAPQTMTYPTSPQPQSHTAAVTRRPSRVTQ